MQLDANSSALEASCVSTYAADYVDFVESFPNLIQPHMSRIRLLDGDYVEVVRELNEAEGELESLKKGTERRRKELLDKIRTLLTKGQRIGDEKLREVALIAELTECKTGQLENDGRNFVVESPRRIEGSGFRPRNVSITGRSNFGKGNEGGNRNSSHSSHSTEDGGRVERQGRTENNSHTERAVSGGGPKRPRRQKQFPDFIRDPEFVGPRKERIIPPAPQPPPVRTCSASGLSTNGGAGKRKKLSGRKKEAGKGAAKNKSPSAVLFDTPIDPEEPLYCLCQQVSYGEMIGCDYGQCEIEWFHFSCVGLVSKPKGKWFCPNCRGDRPNSLSASLSAK